MYEYESDLKMALHALMDETEGVAEYKWAWEHAQDPELKAMAQKIMADEKQHATMLMQWVTKNIQAELSK